MLDTLLVIGREGVCTNNARVKFLLARGWLATDHSTWGLLGTLATLSHEVYVLVLNIGTDIAEHLTDLFVLLLDGTVGFETGLVVGNSLIVDRELMLSLLELSLQLLSLL